MNRLRLIALLAGVCALAAPLASRADDATYTTIKGQVILPNPPAPAPVNVTADPAHCLAKGPLVSDEVIVDKKTNGLKNVVVWLRPDSDDRKAKFPQDKINPALAKVAPKNHVIDQPCCQFVPRIVAARAGDTLEVKNSAPVAHNINTEAGAIGNVGMQANTNIKAPKPLEASATPIPFACNIHPWMKGQARVFDHPYFAVTDAEGKFEIKDAPAGKFRVVYWHEGGFHKGREGILGETIEVKGTTLELKPLSFVFPPKL